MSPAPPPPEHEPLNEDERALAGLLRALPPAEPSPELNARVLAMARAAVAEGAAPASAAHPTASLPLRRTARRRPLRRSVGLWLGSAAAAVLAAGLGLQLGLGERSSLPAAPTGPGMQAPARAERPLEIEVIRRPPPTDAVRAEAPADPRPTAAEAATRRPTQAELARPEADEVTAASPVMAEPTPPPAPPPPPAPAQTPMAPPAAAVPGAAGTPARTDEARQGATLDRIEVTGSRVRGAHVEGELPPVAADARLKPEDWVERIRERRAAGQQAEARRSLQDFMRSYPYLVVPEDLRPLLHERP